MNLLIRNARKHDKAAFQQLMEQEGKSMYKVAKAILKNDEDVADAIQETWFQETGYADVEWKNFLNGLEEKYRTVIMLYYVEGFKTREIAQILDMNENTVRGRLATARKKLEASYNNSRKTARTVKFEKKTAFCSAERRA